jgi:hypothetical protein
LERFRWPSYLFVRGDTNGCVAVYTEQLKSRIGIGIDDLSGQVMNASKK